MNITGTHINYYHLCRRKLWLFANGINMEHTSELVAEGKLIHETSYPQRGVGGREIEIGGVKIDYYDPQRRIVHEIKKSDRVENAHIWQLKYYLHVLKQHGVADVTGILEYPRLRRREEIALQAEDEGYLENVKTQISQIVQSECPPRVEKKICKNCSYYDFCWVGEGEG